MAADTLRGAQRVDPELGARFWGERELMLQKLVQRRVRERGPLRQANLGLNPDPAACEQCGLGEVRLFTPQFLPLE